MELFQPCEINGFTFKGHAGGDLLRDGAPADFPLPLRRHRAPTGNDFEVIHKAGRSLRHRVQFVAPGLEAGGGEEMANG